MKRIGFVFTVTVLMFFNCLMGMLKNQGPLIPPLKLYSIGSVPQYLNKQTGGGMLTKNGFEKTIKHLFPDVDENGEELKQFLFKNNGKHWDENEQLSVFSGVSQDLKDFMLKNEGLGAPIIFTKKQKTNVIGAVYQDGTIIICNPLAKMPLKIPLKKVNFDWLKNKKMLTPSSDNDFVVLLFILWLISQFDHENKKNQQSNFALPNYFKFRDTDVWLNLKNMPNLTVMPDLKE